MQPSLQAALIGLLGQGELDFPLPGRGATTARHFRLLEVAAKNLSLARLVEGHADAIAILADAGRKAMPKHLYAVWASDSPHKRGLDLQSTASGYEVSGIKMFCTGAALVHRALVTCGGANPLLLDIDLKRSGAGVRIDTSDWKTEAFRETETATVEFTRYPVAAEDVVGTRDWYLNRPGFWHGACGPASCWAGGAIALVRYAESHARDNAHASAHLGAMQATKWAMSAFLDRAGTQIDNQPEDLDAARILALQVRHLIEQGCVDILNRFGRGLGPRPLIYDPVVSRQYSELQLYIRQCHGELDLEALARHYSGVSVGK